MMAEKKYDLLLGPKRDSNLKIRNQPWYRERLISKYKYDRKPALDTSTWTFIKDGQDDFRDGRPPSPDDPIVIKGNKGVSPAVLGSDSFDRKKAGQQRTKKLFTKDETIYSKTIPNQGKRRKKVEDIENSLLSHPLALYPNIGRSLPTDVFENIIGILDPILALSDKKPLTGDGSERRKRSQIDDLANKMLPKSNNTQQSNDKEPIPGYGRAIRNVFKTTENDSNNPEEETTKEEKPKSRTERRKTIQQQFHTATSLSKIDYVTKEFCDWVRNLGGEGNNIEEESIKSLFASSTETTNPVLSNPVGVVELTNVPPDLRMRSKKNTPLSPVADDEHLQEMYIPSWNKIKYGAWYLEPNMWRVRPASEKLQDPKELEGKKMSQTRQKSKDLDKILSELHGAQSFRQFIVKKGNARKPEFLESIAQNPDEENNEAGNLSRIHKTNTAKMKPKP